MGTNATEPAGSRRHQAIRPDPGHGPDEGIVNSRGMSCGNVNKIVDNLRATD
jgi:hypothetical protein